MSFPGTKAPSRACQSPLCAADSSSLNLNRGGTTGLSGPGGSGGATGGSGSATINNTFHAGSITINLGLPPPQMQAHATQHAAAHANTPLPSPQSLPGGMQSQLNMLMPQLQQFLGGGGRF